MIAMAKLPPGLVERLDRLAAATTGPFGPPPFRALARDHLAMLEEMRALGASWPQVGEVLARFGITADDGTPIATPVLRATVSAARKAADTAVANAGSADDAERGEPKRNAMQLNETQRSGAQRSKLSRSEAIRSERKRSEVQVAEARRHESRHDEAQQGEAQDAKSRRRAVQGVDRRLSETTPASSAPPQPSAAPQTSQTAALRHGHRHRSVPPNPPRPTFSRFCRSPATFDDALLRRIELIRNYQPRGED